MYSVCVTAETGEGVVAESWMFVLRKKGKLATLGQENTKYSLHPMEIRRERLVFGIRHIYEKQPTSTKVAIHHKKWAAHPRQPKIVCNIVSLDGTQLYRVSVACTSEK